MRSLPPRLRCLRGVIVYPPAPAPEPVQQKRPIKDGDFFFPSLLPPPTPDKQTTQTVPRTCLTFPFPPTQPDPPARDANGRRKTPRACATTASMLSSSRGVLELRRAVADAEVSATAAGATGSEAARPGDRGGRNSSGRGAAARTSSTGVDEGSESQEDSPARKPDPEPGRMDHHQPGTGRYQVVSSCVPAPAFCAPQDPRAASRRGPGSPLPPAKNCLIFLFFLHTFPCGTCL